jgi:hypothetical protein
MVLAMLQCSMVGKWTAGAVKAESGKVRLNPEVSGGSRSGFPVRFQASRRSQTQAPPGRSAYATALNHRAFQPNLALLPIRHSARE